METQQSKTRIGIYINKKLNSTLRFLSFVQTTYTGKFASVSSIIETALTQDVPSHCELLIANTPNMDEETRKRLQAISKEFEEK